MPLPISRVVLLKESAVTGDGVVAKVLTGASRPTFQTAASPLYEPTANIVPSGLQAASVTRCRSLACCTG